ncbi:MAG: CDP-diacylglycerol--serine O-phosphatidyltransferase [Verrucomicrobia bacterium]|nr:CDP-diacylglycerol--serine O-phosphatidyltransferase [Verrucomicrobiota bacterium]
MGEDNSVKIYLLPNLMTAGNLFCGFAASLKIVENATVYALPSGTPAVMAADTRQIHYAIWLILASCIFDLLDGRLARLGGHESPFGREFDSLADIVSFGVAPALMVYKIVLYQFPRTGWLIASVYLVCGALRLARFNCLAAANSAEANREFTGFPIPAAAGLIASLTLFILFLDENERQLGASKWVLPPLMLFLAWMMFSKFRYPSFKGLSWRSTRSLSKFVAILVVAVVTALNFEWMPFLLFLSYLLYGFLRPFLSREMKRDIEEDDEEEEVRPMISAQGSVPGTPAESPKTADTPKPGKPQS